MYRTFRYLIIVLFLSGIFRAQSQVSISDSSITVPIIGFSYSLQLPGGDIAKRFGINSAIGADFKIKTSSNWIIGADFNFIFGSKIKNSDSVMRRIRTNTGEIITTDGSFASWQMFERGFYTGLKVGKLFPAFGPNPNSGILIMGSVGYIQHKIRIEIENNNVQQLSGDYKRGYDRLTGGFAISQFVGYLYVGNSKVLNFYAGFEFVQAWTKDLRNYNFDDMKYTDNRYFDLLSGFKIGWFIPLHKRAPREFYYN